LGTQYLTDLPNAGVAPAAFAGGPQRLPPRRGQAVGARNASRAPLSRLGLTMQTEGKNLQPALDCDIMLAS
jgi:hypothetical protein